MVACFSKKLLVDFCNKVKAIPIVGGRERFLEHVKEHGPRLTSFVFIREAPFDAISFALQEKVVC